MKLAKSRAVVGSPLVAGDIETIAVLESSTSQGLEWKLIFHVSSVGSIRWESQLDSETDQGGDELLW